MKLRPLLISMCALSLAALTGCFPNISRTNARIEQDWDVAVSGAGGYMAKGSGDSLDAPNDKWGLLAELDVQYGKTLDEDFGWAVQLKVPYLFVFSALDTYFQLNATHPNYFGLGFEVGTASGIYASYSHYFSESTYVTLTPRLLYYFPDATGKTSPSRNYKDDRLSHFWLNPQIAFGVLPKDSAVDLSIFANYNHILGEGVDFEFCFFDFTNECEKNDFRKHFVQIGGQARF